MEELGEDREDEPINELLEKCKGSSVVEQKVFEHFQQNFMTTVPTVSDDDDDWLLLTRLARSD